MGAGIRVLVASVLFYALAVPCHSEPAIVTVSSPDLETMNALTAAINMDASMTRDPILGVFEGTQSQVVDAAEPYPITAVQSVPTLSMLDGVSFNNETAVWTIEFETMQIDSSVPDQINRYVRLLYLTLNETERSNGDTRNPCLRKNTSLHACKDALASDYVLVGEMPAVAGAGLERTVECHPACGVNATLESQPGSALQTLTLSIRHEDIRKHFGRGFQMASPLYGSMLSIHFGVGMVFVPAANYESYYGGTPASNVVIFNSFSIVENTFEELAIVKQSAYSIATHVAFWTAVSKHDSAVRLATIEYLLDFGQALENISAAVNDNTVSSTAVTMRSISEADCAAMQALVDDMDDSKCLTKQPLCRPSVYVEGEGSEMQVWATIVFPIPPWHTVQTTQFNTLLRTREISTDMLMLSTLNFASSHSPRIACTETKTSSFDATQHVRAEVYRGSNLIHEKISGTFSVHNDTALSMSEALVTLVLRPDDTQQALEYFATYTDEVLRLDDLYMSHSKITGGMPSSVSNTVQARGGGRTRLIMDQDLLRQCVLKTDQTDSNALCVTTHDWDSDAISRPGGVTFFVHKVHASDDAESVGADVAWLTNVFGSSDLGLLHRFREAVLSRPFSQNAMAQARKQYAAMYWIWPVYSWPNMPPVGLVDRTIISLAWSIAPA
jgi:hypothetical protein